MLVQIQESFQSTAARSAVWALLTDPHRVVRCVPGATLAQQLDEQTYKGALRITVGPIPTSYEGKVRFERVDSSAWTLEVTASGKEVGGRGGAELRTIIRLIESTEGGTRGTVTSDLTVTGFFAQFGQSVIREIGAHMFRQFSDAMAAQLEGEQQERTGTQYVVNGRNGESQCDPLPPSRQPETLSVVSIGTRVGKTMLRRLVRRVSFWVGSVLLGLVAYWIWWR